MNKFLTLVGVFALLMGISVAGPQKTAKTTMCPVCKMSLSAKKDKTHTVAVRLKKGAPVMYCCAGCKMPASVLVKSTGAKPIKKGASTMKPKAAG